jgi:hypothetical protein
VGSPRASDTTLSGRNGEASQECGVSGLLSKKTLASASGGVPRRSIHTLRTRYSFPLCDMAMSMKLFVQLSQPLRHKISRAFKDIGRSSFTRVYLGRILDNSDKGGTCTKIYVSSRYDVRHSNLSLNREDSKIGVKVKKSLERPYRPSTAREFKAALYPSAALRK